MSWDGTERRRYANGEEHCGMHADNTRTLNDSAKDIAGIKSSLFTGRWIFGIVIGIVVLAVGSTLTDIKTGIKDMRTDVSTSMSDIRVDIKEVQAVAVPIAYKVEVLQEQVGELKEQVKDHKHQ